MFAQVGYCQGMNFVAGFILMVAGRVPDAPKVLLRRQQCTSQLCISCAVVPGCIFAARADDGKVPHHEKVCEQVDMLWQMIVNSVHPLTGS